MSTLDPCPVTNQPSRVFFYPPMSGVVHWCPIVTTLITFCPYFYHVSSLGPLVFCRSFVFCFIPVVRCYLLLLYFLIVSCRQLFSLSSFVFSCSPLSSSSMFLALLVTRCLPLPSNYYFALFPDDLVSPLPLSLSGQSSTRLTFV